MLFENVGARYVFKYWYPLGMNVTLVSIFPTTIPATFVWEDSTRLFLLIWYGGINVDHLGLFQIAV